MDEDDDDDDDTYNRGDHHRLKVNCTSACKVNLREVSTRKLIHRYFGTNKRPGE
jgi:hypothetical protein